MDVTDPQAWIAIATSVGVIPAVFWYIKRWAERRRWIRFERAVDGWLNSADDPHPKVLSQEGWKSFCAIKLSDAEFTPTEIHEHLEIAILIAKGRASLVLGDFLESPP